MPLTKKETQAINILIILTFIIASLRAFWEEPEYLKIPLTIAQLIFAILLVLVAKPWKRYMES